MFQDSRFVFLRIWSITVHVPLRKRKLLFFTVFWSVAPLIISWNFQIDIWNFQRHLNVPQVYNYIFSVLFNLGNLTLFSFQNFKCYHFGKRYGNVPNINWPTTSISVHGANTHTAPHQLFHWGGGVTPFSYLRHCYRVTIRYSTREMESWIFSPQDRLYFQQASWPFIFHPFFHHKIFCPKELPPPLLSILMVAPLVESDQCRRETLGSMPSQMVFSPHCHTSRYHQLTQLAPPNNLHALMTTITKIKK